jgi:hypothetical protein
MAGLRPPVEMAINRSPRRTRAGGVNEQFRGSSALLTQIPRSVASAATRALTTGSSVAVTTSHRPSRSSGW